MKHFIKLNLAGARKVFVVGDIHGAFSKLEKELDAIGFDKLQDHLLSVGDLIDRGPENDRVLEFLAQPWFHAVQGNHEQLAYTPRASRVHNQSGGKWFSKLFYKNTEQYYKIKAALWNLPVLIEAITPSLRKVGIAHAVYPSNDWNKASEIAESHKEQILWDRKNIDKAFSRSQDSFVIENVDAVFYGHNPLNHPFSRGNQHWIDTYGFADNGYFTVVEVT